MTLYGVGSLHLQAAAAGPQMLKRRERGAMQRFCSAAQFPTQQPACLHGLAALSTSQVCKQGVWEASRLGSEVSPLP